MEAVLPLRDVGRDDLAVAGGKGANLGELVRAGYAVPDGFVITTAAYARATAGLALSATDAGATRDGIADAALPGDVHAAILDAYEQLGSGAVAVRSSATAEDLPGAAFAGQQETFLNVQGSAEVLDAVRLCWASLWSDRAISYRAQRGIPDGEVQIAVVVQLLVAADLAGVMFTADPVTGERDRVVIDASPGLGEAVVSGLVTPQHVVLDARDRVVEQHRGNAEVVIRAAEGGGTSEEAGSPTDLSLEQARRLAAVGRSIAARFGVAQDIEWAFEGERLWVLQARPLTALPPLPRRVNAVRRLMGSIVAELLPIRPYPLDMSTWTLRGHGRILTRMLAEIPGVRLDLRRMLPETAGVVDELVPPEPRPTPRTLTTPVRAIRQAKRFDTREWTGDPRFAQYEREIADLGALEPRSLGWGELVGIPDRVLSSLDGLITLRIDYLPHAGLSLLKLRLRLGVLGLIREAGPLSRGLQTRTSQANLDLAALARLLASRPEWLQAFRQSDPEQFAQRLASDEELADLREPIAAYLSEYGHREVRSAFLMSEPTWGETPALLYAGIDGSLDRPEAGEAGYDIAAAAVERVQSSRRVRLTRSAPAILAAAAAARSGIVFREDTHFHATRGLPVLRGALLEAGRRLAGAGVLDDAEDVMHLRLAEIAALAAPEAADTALRDTVLARKARRASFAGGPLISPATLYPHRRGTRDALVAGTPAGGGRATGVVRVVKGPSDFPLLLPGEVLVCPYTNPSWTPLFERAAAVVVDTGGLASHAAIVAREYGLPAVMGTGVGTAVLHDGDFVTVDGDAGSVVAAPTRS